MVANDDHLKKEDDDSGWVIITVIITIPIAAIAVVSLIVYISWDFYKKNRAAYKRSWKIAISEIELIPIETLRNSTLFSRTPGLRSRRVFADGRSNASHWVTGTVKVGLYQVCYVDSTHYNNDNRQLKLRRLTMRCVN